MLVLVGRGAAAATLVVVVAGVRNSHGNVEIGVYSDAKEWPDGKTVVEGRLAAAPEVRFTFPNLAPGDYAVSGFHDENANGKFDTNAVGFPLEGFAFSNDLKPFLSAPMFEAAAVTLGEGETTITIHMQYWSTK
jgi:uncharacterized protein (DUF2141 family)